MLLHDAARLLHEQAERAACPSGLSNGERQVLQVVKAHEGVNQSAFADALEIDPLTLDRMLERMEAQGFVERRGQAADRRERSVFVGPRSRAQTMRTEDGSLIGESVMSGLSASDQAFLYQAFSQIKSNLLNPDDDCREHEAPHD